ncbi:MAG TPA: lysophospholipid acyltransferase family protein [Candidatus Thermoplasmatota archaeon]|nr:lysophospholipid acyltransferase family protein [Candidatus Thermoplasmatota archaeon]
MSLLWSLMRPIAVPFIRLGFRVKVVGRRNIPKKGAAILASNHLSALDHVILPMATRRPIVNISKVEHFESGRAKAWFFRQWHVIPIERGRGDQAALDAARGALGDGRLLCIYPEGTRSLDGRLHKGHTGVARLALEMRVPIVPIAMVGTYEARPKGGKMRLFTKTGVIAGSPVDVSRHWGRQADKAVCRKVTDEVMLAIARLSGQEYVPEYQFNPEVPAHAKPRKAG